MTDDKEILKLILKNQSLLLQVTAIILINNTKIDSHNWFWPMKKQAEETEAMIEKLNKS